MGCASAHHGGDGWHLCGSASKGALKGESVNTIAAVQETKPLAGYGGEIIPYSVTWLFRRTSDLWQRPLALPQSDKATQPTGKLAPAGLLGLDAVGWGCWGWRRSGEAGTLGELLRGRVDTGQTAHPGYLSEAKGLVQGLGAPTQASLTPPGTAAQT